MKINDLLIEDIAWTLRNFTAKIIDWEETSSWERDHNEDPYKQAAHAMLIATKIGYGDCYPIDTFIKEVRNGSFIDNYPEIFQNEVKQNHITDNDGSGSWVDFEGNKISSIKCDANWLKC